MKLKISASQVEKLRRCPRAYAFEYVEKFRPPASPKQQFGTDVHAKLENWISKSEMPDDSPAGKMAKMAITKGVIPPPQPGLLVEDSFTYRWNEHIDVGGFIDLTIPPEIAALNIPEVDDYKTTSDLRWAKTPVQLEQDPQALLYAIRAMFRYNTPEVRCKWIYLASTAPLSGNRKPTGVKTCPVLFNAHDKGFLDEVRRLDQDIREIYRISSQSIRGLSLPPNPDSCEMFGGCFHKDRCNLDPGDMLVAYMEKETLKHNKKENER